MDDEVEAAQYINDHVKNSTAFVMDVGPGGLGGLGGFFQLIPLDVVSDVM